MAWELAISIVIILIILEFFRKEKIYSYIVASLLVIAVSIVEVIPDPTPENLGALMFYFILLTIASIKSYKKIQIGKGKETKKRTEKIIFWIIVGLPIMIAVFFLLIVLYALI